MNKVLIVIMFILLGTSLVVITNMNKGVENSFVVQYHNNHNLALPDLNGKAEISFGIYRLYNDNGITLDYNINNGIYTINGVATMDDKIDLIPLQQYNNEYYTSTLYIHSGTYIGSLWLKISYSRGGISYMQNQIWNYDGITTQTITSQLINDINPMLLYSIGYQYNNLTFKLQLSKGSYLLPYVVPKLLPVYKDNLTLEEKQNIGFGAFAGFTEIIRSINNIIQPVSDFINGILNLF